MIGPDLNKEGCNLGDFESKVWVSFLCCLGRLFHGAAYTAMKTVFVKPAGSAYKPTSAAKGKLVFVSQRDTRLFTFKHFLFLRGFRCVYVSLSNCWFLYPYWFSHLWLIDAVHISSLWTATLSSLILWTFLGTAFLTGDFSIRGFFFILAPVLNSPHSLSGHWECMSDGLWQNLRICAHFFSVRYL